ncbi:MAG: SDR family NAD(P)-dependent oxidoreductase [Rhodospirillaceae bacterium]|nr:SDR family NAD(P)-dependent oxidoreductase [Rhodospirillaceae bacterium]
MELSGHTILITGGGSGIGLALAKTFIAAGNEVIIAGRDRATLEATVAQNPGLQLVTCDIQNTASITALCA